MKVPKRPRVSTNGRGFQPPVCTGHRIDGYAKLAGQLTHGRQPGAGRQRAIADSIDDLRPELVEQWPARLQVDLQPFRQLHVPSITQAPLCWLDASDGAQRRGNLRGERRAEVSLRQKRVV